jgi:hypothetical protein
MTAASAKAAPCDHWERAGAIAWERGEADPHLGTCAVCQQKAETFHVLRRELGALPPAAPRPHWEQKVWAQLDRGKRGGLARFWAIAPLAAAAGIALFLLQRPAPAPDGAVLDVSFGFERPAAAARTRGEGAVGDTLVLKASGLADAVAEWRIYQDHAGLRFRCAGEPPCERRENALIARFRVPAIGRYQAVLVTGPRDVVAPTSGRLDEDLAALSANPALTTKTIDVEVW